MRPILEVWLQLIKHTTYVNHQRRLFWYISMAYRKTAVTPLLVHWGYRSLVLSHRCTLSIVWNLYNIITTDPPHVHEASDQMPWRVILPRYQPVMFLVVKSMLETTAASPKTTCWQLQPSTVWGLNLAKFVYEDMSDIDMSGHILIKHQNKAKTKQ